MLGHALRSTGTATKDYYRSNTVALLSADGANDSTTIVDSSPLAANWTAGGTAKLSTAQAKFGTASLVFDGATGTHVTASAATTNFAFGTGDFTVEMSVYPTTLAGYARLLYDHRPAGTQGFYPAIYLLPTGQLCYYVNGTNRITGSLLALNTWYHVAVSRSGTSTRMFLNGTQDGSTYTDSASYLCPASRPRIGANGNAEDLNNFIGHVDEVRVTKAARYTANFTAPTSAYPTRG